MSLRVYLCAETFKKRIVMKTEEKTSMDEVAQVVFRPSSERRGYYRFHYGYFTSDGTFTEAADLDFLKFLGLIDIPIPLVASMSEKFDAAELGVCGFGYLSQERFDDFMRYFADSSDTIQLYPGMLVLTFHKNEDEG